MADPQSPPRPRLSLVIPAYNEEAGIRQAVAEADAALARVASEYEILVVDDGSADGTAAVVGRAGALADRVGEAAGRRGPRAGGVRKVWALRGVPRVRAALLPRWWSRVLFPALSRERPASAGPTLAGRSRLNRWALVA